MVGGYSIGMCVLGALAGLVLGLAVGYGNSRITKAAVAKNNGNGMAAIAATNLVRTLINLAAMALVFFTRNLVPFPLLATLLGCAGGLAGGGIYFTWRLAQQLRRDAEQTPSDNTDPAGGE